MTFREMIVVVLGIILGSIIVLRLLEIIPMNQPRMERRDVPPTELGVPTLPAAPKE